MVALAVLLLAISVPAQYHRLDHPPADVHAQVVSAGLSISIYAAWLTVLNAVFALVCYSVAALIVRHRSSDQVGLLASLYLVLLGSTSAPAMQALGHAHRALARPAGLANAALAVVLIAFYFLFPDGRFAPRWAWIPLLITAVGVTALFIRTDASVNDPPGWLAMTMLAGTIAGIAAQIARHARADDPQRLQIRCVLLGATVANLTMLAFAFLGATIPTIGRPETGYDLTSTTVVTFASLAIPLTIGFAILRHRLWGIDGVVNRTMVFGTLTTALLALYLGLVEGLGALVEHRGRLPLSLLATALIAVLFAPLQHWLQGAVNRLMYGDRDDPYRVLTRLGERLGAALVPDATLSAVGETVAQALKSPHVAVTLYQDDPDTPAPAPEPRGDEPLRLPIEYQGEAVGELLVAPRGPGERFSETDRRLLGDLARQIGPAAHAIRLTAELQRARERLVTAREEERRRLRRDLHDGLGPQLAALTLKIETIRNRFARDRELDASLVDLTVRTQDALADIRRLVYGLRPPALDELGLLAAIHQAAAQCDRPGEPALHVTVDAPVTLPPLPAAVEVAAYCIVQEGLTNVVRHARASTCVVSLSLDARTGSLGLRVTDDGIGLPAQARAGVGTLSMRERTEELGGCWQMATGELGGTVVSAALPCSVAGGGA